LTATEPKIPLKKLQHPVVDNPLMNSHFKVENKLKATYGINCPKHVKKKRSSVPFALKPQNILASSDDLKPRLAQIR